MAAPRWLARVNRRLTNRLLGRVAAHLPGFGVVVHTGRISRRQYRTPVNVFRHAGAYVIALTYGPDAQWVRNVLANGGCALVTGGRRLELTEPRLFYDPARPAVPPPVHAVLRLLDVADFLELWPRGGAAHPGDVLRGRSAAPIGQPPSWARRLHSAVVAPDRRASPEPAVADAPPLARISPPLRTHD